MTIIVDGQEINQIIIGPDIGIQKVYYGSTLVWEVSTLLKKTTAYSGTLNIYASGLYEITMSGSGGLGRRAAYNQSTNWGEGGTGGGGSAFKGVIFLSPGTYNIVVDGAASEKSTYISKDGVMLISCGSGKNGAANRGGAGGTITKDSSLIVISSVINGNGNSGNHGVASGSGGAAWVSGAASLLQSYGISNGSSSGGTVGFHYGGNMNGTDGYFELKFAGSAPDFYTYTISPTPSDATVVLTASGYTQVGNSITVLDGTTVSWSVSKSGYETQTGTATVTQDTTNSVELEEYNPPLYYCYTFPANGGTAFAYFAQKLQLDSLVNSSTTYMRSDGSQATQSSQITNGAGSAFVKVIDMDGENAIVSDLFGGSVTFTRRSDGDLYT